MKGSKQSAGQSAAATRKRAGGTSEGRARRAAEEQPERADAPEYQTFTVRFLLDPRGVRRTEVAHVQEGASEAWAGYDAGRLDEWIAARLARGAQEGPAAVPEAEATGGAPQAERPALLSPALRDLELRAVGGAGRLVAAGAPLTARLAFELGGADAPGQPVRYTVSAYARNLGGGRVLLGEADGQAAAGEATLVELAAVAPAPGLYRVGATVTVHRPGWRSESLSGGLLQVQAADGG
jgi:hypothetical protein